MELSGLYMICKRNRTSCRQIPEYELPDLERYRRSFWNGKKEPICKLNCDCTPDFQATINQAGTVEQASKQEQTVTIKQASGLVVALGIAGILVCLIFCCWMQRAKCCIGLRAKLKMHSHKDIEKVHDAEAKMEKGLPLSKSEKKAVKKLAVTHEKNEKALQVFAKVNNLVKPKPKPITTQPSQPAVSQPFNQPMTVGELGTSRGRPLSGTDGSTRDRRSQTPQRQRSRLDLRKSKEDLL